MSDTLIISVSGMRGIVGKDLTPEIVSRHAAAFGRWALDAGGERVVVGRDSRTSGAMFAAAVEAGLQSVGCGVISGGIIPTPTVQLAVEHHRAGGGIIITASHNPVEWNALKFVGPDGIFLDAAAGAAVRELAAAPAMRRADWDGIGAWERDAAAVSRHIDAVLALDCIDVDAIRAQQYTVALDAVCGVGGVAMPPLLEALGCRVVAINGEASGRFPRPPEPIPEHLGELGDLVRRERADVGLGMDPDGDRLALVDEQGQAIGEDYTVALAVHAVLGTSPGPVVVNLSTSRVVDDAAAAYGVDVVRAPVGEANVARAMQAEGAIVGGEGNGGVMLPALHVGRDALVAAALVLTLLARSGKGVSTWVEEAPRYRLMKGKGPRGADLDAAYAALETTFTGAAVDRRDGLRLSWPDAWLHVRPSGTEPIVRYIAEATTGERAAALIDRAQSALGGAA